MSSLVIDRQAEVRLFQSDAGIEFSWEKKSHSFDNLKAVRKFFRDQTDLTTVKFKFNSCNEYAHFNGKEIQIYKDKQSLRSVLSIENSGAWGEAREGKIRYFIQEKGWFQPTIKEVTSKKECLEHLQKHSNFEKVSKVALALLGISTTLTKNATMGSGEIFSGILAHRSPAISMFSLAVLCSGASGQSINVFNTSGGGRPDLEFLGNDQFVIVYEGDGIFGEIMQLPGQAVGEPFLANSFTETLPTLPKVQRLADGSFVVVWESHDQIDREDIFGQHFTASGGRIGNEFLVNVNQTASRQQSPQIALLSSDDYVVTWNGGGRVFSPSGSTSEFNFDPVGSWFSSTAISPIQTGGFVHIESGEQVSGNSDIFGRVFSNNGTEIIVPFQVNTFSDYNQDNPDVTVLMNGNFVVVWDSQAQDGYGKGIFGQICSPNGTKIGSEFQLNTFTDYDQIEPKITAFDTGNFAVVWMQDGGTGNKRVVVQRFDESGNKIGNEIEVHDGGLNARILGLPGGGFVVLYRTDLLQGVLYDENGERVPQMIATQNPGSTQQLSSEVVSSSPTTDESIPEETAGSISKFFLPAFLATS